MNVNLLSGPRLRELAAVAGSVLVLIVVIALVGWTFAWAHARLTQLGWTHSLWQSAAVWWAAGVVCALFWPLCYYDGMRGLWRESFLTLALLSLCGPWALLFGFPL